jgi:preprotein translocase subunit YajC
MTFIALLAQATTDTPKANPLVSLMPIILIFGAMYFLMIRPQRNKQRQFMELLRSLEVGDDVETVAGIFGTIRRLDDDTAWVEIAPGTTIKMSRAGIRRKVVSESENESS